MQDRFLTIIQRVQALANTGLTFASGPYDLERYEELRELSVEMFSLISEEKIEKLEKLFVVEPGYQTPKVDVRALVEKEGKILLVKEKADERWSLPGGWADVGYTPSEVAVKEVREEANLHVKAERLLAVFDKRCHPHPPYPEYTYKLCLSCKIESGEMQAGLETLEVAFFDPMDLPELSEERITASQIALVYDIYKEGKSSYCD